MSERGDRADWLIVVLAVLLFVADFIIDVKQALFIIDLQRRIAILEQKVR